MFTLNDVRNGEHCSQPTLIVDRFEGKVDYKIQMDRLFMLDSLHMLFHEISRALLHKIVIIHLVTNHFLLCRNEQSSHLIQVYLYKIVQLFNGK